MKTLEKIDKIGSEVPVILKVTNNGINAEFINNSGQKIYKNIGLPSMARIWSKEAEFDSGFLPAFGKNYIATKRYIKYSDKDILFVEASPSRRTINFNNGKKYENVMFPGLLMGIMCKRKTNGDIEIVTERLYATVGPILRDTDPLFIFPFANVHAQSGSICWGGINYRRNIKTIAQAGSILDTFLYNTMNSDLYDKSTFGVSLPDLITSLQNSESFPYEKLKKAGLTFKELNSLLKNRRNGGYDD